MLGVQLIPVILSLLVLGAHFYRVGNLALVALVLVVLGMIFVRRPWAARVIQFTLVLGALEWVRATVVIASYRADLGLPYGRLLAILGTVALVCLLSAGVFRTRRARRWYRLGGDTEELPS